MALVQSNDDNILHNDGHAKPNVSKSEHFLILLFILSLFFLFLSNYLPVFVPQIMFFVSFSLSNICYSLSLSHSHSHPFSLCLIFPSFLFFSCWSCQINGLAEANARIMWSPTTEKCFFPNVCQSHQSHGGASFS